MNRDHCNTSPWLLGFLWTVIIVASTVAAVVVSLEELAAAEAAKRARLDAAILAPIDCAQAAVVAGIIASGRARGMTEDIAAGIVADRMQSELAFVPGVVFADPHAPEWVAVQNVVSRCRALNAGEA